VVAERAAPVPALLRWVTRPDTAEPHRLQRVTPKRPAGVHPSLARRLPIRRRVDSCTRGWSATCPPVRVTPTRGRATWASDDRYWRALLLGKPSQPSRLQRCGLRAAGLASRDADRRRQKVLNRDQGGRCRDLDQTLSSLANHAQLTQHGVLPSTGFADSNMKKPLPVTTSRSYQPPRAEAV
jgi:hypothetical protein